jgi:hypothetical protein
VRGISPYASPGIGDRNACSRPKSPLHLKVGRRLPSTPPPFNSLELPFAPECHQTVPLSPGTRKRRLDTRSRKPLKTMERHSV